jgi:O-succinylbenzoic acid--CoA ligase
MPTGPEVLDLLPDLARALAGGGPTLLPLSGADPRSGDIARILAAGEPLGPGEDDPADPTALVVATSGSTGIPKGVLLGAGALAASAAATEARLGGPGNWLLALPAHHIAGMQVLLRAAAAGTDPVVLDTAEPFTAERFAVAAGRVPGPRRYVSLVPTQLQRVLAHPGARDAAAELFDAILVGGSATPASLLAHAWEAGLTVVTTYGMTETCGGCVYDGRPLPGVTASIAGSGALVLTGPIVARGYRNRPGDPAFAIPGSFVTADAGRVDGTGAVTVLGRLDDIIVTGGVKVAPAAVEAALLALPGVDSAVVVGAPDAQWGQAVTALLVADPSWDVAAVRAALTDLPAGHRPQRVVHLDTIPMLASGKPDRATARRLAAGG